MRSLWRTWTWIARIFDISSFFPTAKTTVDWERCQCTSYMTRQNRHWGKSGHGVRIMASYPIIFADRPSFSHQLPTICWHHSTTIKHHLPPSSHHLISINKPLYIKTYLNHFVKHHTAIHSTAGQSWVNQPLYSPAFSFHNHQKVIISPPFHQQTTIKPSLSIG